MRIEIADLLICGIEDRKMRRQHQRYELRQKAKLWYNNAECSVAIHDISAGGLGFKADLVKLKPGSKVSVLISSDLRVSGSVCWSGTEKSGMTFDDGTKASQSLKQLIARLVETEKASG